MGECDHWVEVTLADLARQIDPSAKAPPKSGAMVEAVDAKIASTPADAAPKYARLRAARLPQSNTLNIYLSLLPATLGKEKSLTLLGLAKKQALTAARAEIRSWADLADLSVLDAGGLRYVAQAHAFAGHLEQVEEVLAPMDRPANADQRAKLLAIATTVAGDFTQASDILQAAGPEDYYAPLLYAIDAYLTAGQGEVERLLTLLPPPDAARCDLCHWLSSGRGWGCGGCYGHRCAPEDPWDPAPRGLASDAGPLDGRHGA
jgi:hypothetical protein